MYGPVQITGTPYVRVKILEPRPGLESKAGSSGGTPSLAARPSLEEGVSSSNMENQLHQAKDQLRHRADKALCDDRHDRPAKLGFISRARLAMLPPRLAVMRHAVLLSVWPTALSVGARPVEKHGTDKKKTFPAPTVELTCSHLLATRPTCPHLYG
jgi:hypothetical protein